MPPGRDCLTVAVAEGFAGMTISVVGANGAGRLMGVRTRRPGVAAGGFNVPEDAAAPGIDAVEGAVASTVSGGGAGVEAVADRAARRHGQDLLAELARLQRDMLRPGGRSQALERLAVLAADTPPAADPALAMIVDGIVLRAKVELARRMQP
jgi:hypothetical protein